MRRDRRSLGQFAKSALPGFLQSGLKMRIGIEDLIALPAPHPSVRYTELVWHHFEQGGARGALRDQAHLRNIVEPERNGLERRCHQYPAIFLIGHF